MEDYSITVIQDEAVPLASMPNSIIDSSQWVLVMIAILVLVILLSYLIVCRKKEQHVLTLISKLEDNDVSYNRFNYFKMTEVEQELRYLVLEQESLKES